MTMGDTKTMIQGFEDGTWPKEQWTHHAHFIMALWYCYHLPLPIAITQIKEGIQRYNIAVGGENTSDSGYHETITVFYIYAINHYIMQAANQKKLEVLLNGLMDQPFIAKDFALQYYSREVLMSKEARTGWIYPDKQSFCFAE